MPLSREQARDQILSLVHDVAKGLIDTSTGKSLQILFADLPAEIPRENPPTPWARAILTHQASNQATLAGDTGLRRYTRTGLITIQLFTPSGLGSLPTDRYAEAFVAKFQGRSTPEGVWFRAVNAQEVGTDGPWQQTNITGTFEYDELA